MTHGFDKEFWEQHWRESSADSPRSMATNPPNPYLDRELGDVEPGTALDVGCGAGAEAIWLAGHGWQVTAADISAEALGLAVERATAAGVSVHWVEADLSTWEPDDRFDLVTTHYAHPATPQLELYDRIAEWVAPGGSLLIVGHLQGEGHGHGHGHQPPTEASVSAAAITARLDGSRWRIVTADEVRRTMPGREAQLDDVVVRATRTT